MNTIVKGIFGVIKLCVVLYAVYYAIESGLLEKLINMF
jgi:hypothetical protein